MRERIPVIARRGTESRVKHSLAEATDINAIMARWISHGTPPPQAGREPQYGDFSNATDYTAAMTRIKQADSDFAALPAAVRAHVANDPGKFLDLCHDENRKQELVDLGLIPERDPAPEVKAAPVDADPVAPPAVEDKPPIIGGE